MAITWRSVANPIANNQAELLRQGNQSIQRGISGLGNLASGIANDMDADQLNAALAQIRGLNTVEGAQQAQQQNLVSTLGLNDEQQIQARNALDTQLTNNRQSQNASDTFDFNQLTKAERPLINDFNTRLASDDFAGAREIAGGLSNSGEFLRQINQQENAFTTKNEGIRTAAITNAYNEFANQGDYDSAIRSAQQLPNNAKEVGRLQEEKKAYDNLNLFNSFANGIAGTENEGISGSLGGGETAYEGYAELINNNDELDFKQKADLNNMLKAFQSNDPKEIQRVKDEALAKEKALFDKQVEREITKAETDSRIAQNPLNPALTPNENLKISDVLAEFEPLTKFEDEYFSFGVGDFEAFSKKAMSSVNKGYDIITKDENGKPKTVNKRYNPVVVAEALRNTKAVREAKIGGNLGDGGDNINTDEFENLLDLYQRLYNENDDRIEANLLARKESIRAGNFSRN